MAQKINKLITPYNKSSRGGEKIKWIVIHYVGALGDAKQNCQYYASQKLDASAHYYVGFAGDVWQSVEDKDKAWSVGVNYGNKTLFGKCTNANSLNIELCVRKRSTRTMNATDTDWYFEDATVKAAATLTRAKMKQYGIDADHVVRHYDVCNKVCPAPFVHNTTEHTWSEFKKLIGAEGAPDVEIKWFRVGTDWQDGQCIGQIGAFEIEENAVKCAETSFCQMKVFDSTGKCVYTSAAKPGGTQARAILALGDEKTRAQAMLELVHKTDKSGILNSLTTAQMILESGYCGTDLATEANNCFGMKCSLSGNTWKSVWDGVSEYRKVTAEQDKAGNTYYIRADFRKYPCVEDSIRDHSLYLLGAKNGDKQRYAGLLQCKNIKEAAQCVKTGGYATDTQYVSKLVNIVQRFGLDKYDGATPAPQPAPEPSPTPAPQPGRRTRYRVQAGSFSNSGYAIAQAERVRPLVPDVWLTIINGNYKVIAGSFDTKKAAEERRKFLIDHDIDACVEPYTAAG